MEKCIWIWSSANVPCRFQRPPGPIPSSMLGLETVTGSIDHFGFEDCLNGNTLCLCFSCLLACFESFDFSLSCCSCMMYWNWNYGSLSQNLIIVIPESCDFCAPFFWIKRKYYNYALLVLDMNSTTGQIWNFFSYVFYCFSDYVNFGISWNFSFW